MLLAAQGRKLRGEVGEGCVYFLKILCKQKIPRHIKLAIYV
jgi:hypothetical protein